MSYKTCIYNLFSDIGQDEYKKFIQATQSSVFYHPSFLLAAEAFPLLSTLAAYYIVIYRNNQMAGFTPVYLQTSADPFNVLSNASSHVISHNAKALLTHVMHCSNSEYLMVDDDVLLIEHIESALKMLAKELDAEFYGLINIQSERFLKHIDTLGYECHFMWNKFYMDISTLDTLNDFYEVAPRNGRKQYKKNLRKFYSNSSACVRIERATELTNHDLHQIATLCHNTGAKYGTGSYYPIDKLAAFMTICADIITFISVYVDDKRISSNICFIHDETLYMWACGMTYDKADFSPYVITVIKAFEYAKSLNLKYLDIGRTSQAMKERMGFLAKPLFLILNKGAEVECLTKEIIEVCDE